MRRIRMIEIVGIFQRMRQHEARIGLAIDVDHAVEMLLVQLQRIIAAIEELDLRAQQFRRARAKETKPLNPPCGKGRFGWYWSL